MTTATTAEYRALTKQAKRLDVLAHEIVAETSTGRLSGATRDKLASLARLCREHREALESMP